jgi:hypothetical protein
MPDDHAQAKKTSGWYECGNSWEKSTHTAKEIFTKIKDDLLKDRPKDDNGNFLHAPQYLDNDFPTDMCWYAGGSPDALNEVGTEPVKWVRLSSLQGSLSVIPMKTYSQVHQGTTSDGYLCEAMQALAMRRNLVKNLFVDYDDELGIYVVRFYKNAMWVCVIVDDYIPVDKNGHPMCAVNDNFPTVCWAAIVEKAYAKLHFSYEAIGEGGSVAQAMMDLTGGIGGKFLVRDVAPDRLFVYLHELQCDTLLSARPDMRECARRGVRLMNAPYAINRCTEDEGRCWLQLCCPAMIGGPFDDVVPYSLMHNAEFPERGTDGCFWISVEDFQNYFACIFECRLVQAKTLDETSILGQPEPRLLAQRKPLIERSFAFQGLVRAETVPEFHININPNMVPCEIYVSVSQVDLRMKGMRRLPQVPMQLTVHEFISAGTLSGWAFLAKSNYEYERDSMAAFKVSEAGEYLVLVQLPVGEEFEKLIFRTYATTNVEVEAIGIQGRHKRVVTTEPLNSCGLSLVGRSDDASQPTRFDPDEGMGMHHHHHRSWDQDHKSGGCTTM